MEILIILTLFVVVYLFAFKRGWHAYERYIINTAANSIKQDQNLDEPEKIKAQVEQIGNVFYFYDQEDGTFLAQGETFDEVKKNLEDRYKGTKHIVMSAKEAKNIGLL